MKCIRNQDTEVWPYADLCSRKEPGEIDQHLTSAGGGVKLTIPKIEGKRPGFSFSASYAVPVFKSITPADGSYGAIYLNGTIEY